MGGTRSSVDSCRSTDGTADGCNEGVQNNNCGRGGACEMKAASWRNIRKEGDYYSTVRYD